MPPLIAVINITPDPVAIHLGPIPLLWYGIAYAVGLAVTYLVITREARRRRGAAAPPGSSPRDTDGTLGGID